MIEVVNGSRLNIVDDYAKLSEVAAKMLLGHLNMADQANCLMPTGTSPEGMYAHLAEEDPETFRGTTFFNLDEYCDPANEDGIQPLPEDDERSYHYFMRKHILGAQPLIDSHFPGADNAVQRGSYDRTIRSLGGIDLAINGLGEDGHVFGFNMPGASFYSVTRRVALSHKTREVNQHLTGTIVPTHALSTGIATGMASRAVVTLVSGERKATILERVLKGEITEEVPATVLRQHRNHVFLVDTEAAALL